MSWGASAKRVSAPLALAVLGAVLALVALAASSSGAVQIPLRDMPMLLFGDPAPGDTLWRNVLIDIRAPHWPYPVRRCRRCFAIRWPNPA